MVEAHQPLPLAPDDLPPGVPVLIVANKADLGRHLSLPPEAIVVSVRDGQGLDQLEASIEAALLAGMGGETDSALAINARQDATLQRSAVALDRARLALRDSLGLEVVSIELRDALHDLAEVVGETTNEEVLGRLFQNFCIGK